MSKSAMWVGMLALSAGQGALFAQAPMPITLGAEQTATVRTDEPIVYRVEAPSAGVLTVAASSADADIWLMVTDEVGQSLPDGTADRDLRGSLGSEHIVVTLPMAGTYLVRIESRDETSPVVSAASFLPFAPFAQEPDPDGRPATAVVVEAGSAYDDSIDPAAGDQWDWFSVVAPANGTITAVTRSEEGDLVLEAFANAAFDDAVARSDQDLQGSAGSESASIVVRSGETVHFRVSALSSEPAPYRFSVGLIPE